MGSYTSKNIQKHSLAECRPIKRERGLHELDRMAKHIMQEGSVVVYGNRSLWRALAFEHGEYIPALLMCRDLEVKRWRHSFYFILLDCLVGCEDRKLSTPCRQKDLAQDAFADA